MTYYGNKVFLFILKKHIKPGWFGASLGKLLGFIVRRREIEVDLR